VAIAVGGAQFTLGMSEHMIHEWRLRSTAWSRTFVRDHGSTPEGSLIAQLGQGLTFAGERYDSS
jgi:hypothetical protein